MQELHKKAREIKLVIFDVDGVLTNNLIYHSNNGDELKSFSTLDGMGIKLLQQFHIETAIITARSSALVSKRAEELNIKHVYQAQSKKMLAYDELIKKLALEPKQVAYMGDDLPDLALIQRSGLGIAPANAHEIIKQAADWVSTKQGGAGAVRELCDFILQAQGHWQTIIDTYSL